MARSILVMWLSIVLTIAPCEGQVSQEDLRKARASNVQMRERRIQNLASRYEQDLSKASSEKDPATKRKAEWYGAKDATELATIYARLDPTDGVQPDFVQARRWYALATQHGDTDGAYYLGELYWDARGGSADRERAKYIWLWAAENGERKAIVKLEQLGFNMQKERDLAFGKAKAAETPQELANRHAVDAAEGLAIILGGLLIGMMAQGDNGSADCRAYHLAVLAGSPIPPGYVIPTCR